MTVCVLEKDSDVATGASCANSGIVHAGYDAAEGSLKAKLNVKGAGMMPQTAAELGVSYKNNGSLVLGFNIHDCAEIDKLYYRGKNNGVKRLSVLGREQLVQKEPDVSKEAVCALYAPTGGIICPYELTIAAMGNAMDNGVDLMLNFNVTSIEKTGGGYIISDGKKNVKTRCVINAAGVYADKIANMVGDKSFKIHPKRGEYLLLDKTCGDVAKHTIFTLPSKEGKGVLVTPTVDGNLLIGPTSELVKSKDCAGTTADGINKVIKKSSRYLNNIPFNCVITSFAGLRASCDKRDFIINMPKKNFFNIAGIDSPGLSAAPAIAEYAVELMKKAGVVFNKKADFNPCRKSMYYFKRLPNNEKNLLIWQNSRYGKIICRCENVSEGEIVDAIHTNPKATTIDAVKRRTRAGMGRCQSGFCLSGVIDILARELKTSTEKVLKSGGGSYIVLGKIKGGIK